MEEYQIMEKRAQKGKQDTKKDLNNFGGGAGVH